MGTTGQRLLVALVVLLTIAVIVLAAILGWRESNRGEEASSPIAFTAENIIKKYPMHFRTPEQQEYYEQQYISAFENRTLVTEEVPATEFCSFSCAANNPVKRRKRATQSAAAHHGCCVSSVVFQTPDTHNNVQGTTKTLLQLKGVKQYFPEHQCQVSSPCTGCQCAQESNLHTGVVLKIGISKADDVDDTEIDFFQFPGCCKCINN